MLYLSFGNLPLDIAQPMTQFRDLPAEALYRSGATMHDTFGHQIGSPYVVPEAGTGVITDYSA